MVPAFGGKHKEILCESPSAVPSNFELVYTVSMDRILLNLREKHTTKDATS